MTTITVKDTNDSTLISDTAPQAIELPNDFATVTQVDLDGNQIVSTARRGNDLILELSNGKQIILDGYFTELPNGDEHRLLVDDGSGLSEVSFADAGATAEVAAGTGELAASSVFGASSVRSVAGILGIGGAAAAIGGSGDDAIAAPSVDTLVTGLGTTLSGTGLANSVVELTIPGVDEPVEVPVDGNGDWTYTPAAPFENGAVVSATQIGAEGNSAPSAATLQLDTDADGVANTVDIDDDNDGILDVNEPGQFVALNLSALQGDSVTFENGNLILSDYVNGQVQTLANVTVDGQPVSVQAVFVTDVSAQSRQGGDAAGNLILGGRANDAIDPDNPQPVYQAEGGDNVEFNFGQPLVVQFTHETTSFGDFTPQTLGGGDEIRLEAAGGFTVYDPDGQLSIETNENGVLIFTEIAGADIAAEDATWSITTNAPVSTFNVRGNGSSYTPIKISVLNGDTDGDGVIDSLDTDSDGSGVPDNVEAQYNQAYVAPSGLDSDGDGLDDAYDESADQAEGSVGITLADTNEDGTPDVLADVGDEVDNLPFAMDAIFNGVTITGTGLVGANVTLRDAADVVVGTAVVGPDGTWSVTPDDPVFDGAEISALMDEFDPVPGGSAAADVTLVLDTDGDGVADSVDIDDDDDGILDVDETPDMVVLAGVVDGDAINYGVGAFQNSVSFDAGSALASGHGFNFLETTSTAPKTLQFETPIEAPDLVFTGVSGSTRIGRFRVTYSDGSTQDNVEFDVLGMIHPDTDTSSTLTLAEQTYNGEQVAQGNGFQAQGEGTVRFTNLDPDLRVDAISFQTITGPAGYGAAVNIVVPEFPLDVDGDGVINRLDTDSNGDGTGDLLSAQYGHAFVDLLNIDANGDGLDDAFDPSIENGSFDGGADTGWTLSGAARSNVGAFTDAVIINSGSTNADGLAMQTINTIPGQTYVVSFQSLTNGGGADTVSLAARALNGTDEIAQLGVAMNTGDAPVTHELVFEATGTQTTIEFSDTTPVGQNGIDLYLDNVSIDSLGLQSNDIDQDGTIDVYDDVFGLTSANVAALESGVIDFDGEHEAISFDGSGLSLDLTALSNDIFNSVEMVDLGGNGNSLTLNIDDLVDLASSTDQLLINGGATDTVVADSMGQGSFTQTGTTSISGVSYDIYTSGSASLYIEENVNVSFV